MATKIGIGYNQLKLGVKILIINEIKIIDISGYKSGVLSLAIASLIFAFLKKNELFRIKSDRLKTMRRLNHPATEWNPFIAKSGEYWSPIAIKIAMRKELRVNIPNPASGIIQSDFFSSSEYLSMRQYAASKIVEIVKPSYPEHASDISTWNRDVPNIGDPLPLFGKDSIDNPIARASSEASSIVGFNKIFDQNISRSSNKKSDFNPIAIAMEIIANTLLFFTSDIYKLFDRNKLHALKKYRHQKIGLSVYIIALNECGFSSINSGVCFVFVNTISVKKIMMLNKICELYNFVCINCSRNLSLFISLATSTNEDMM